MCKIYIVYANIYKECLYIFLMIEKTGQKENNYAIRCTAFVVVVVNITQVYSNSDHKISFCFFFISYQMCFILLAYDSILTFPLSSMYVIFTVEIHTYFVTQFIQMFLGQMVDALAYLHNRNILHRLIDVFTNYIILYLYYICISFIQPPLQLIILIVKIVA